MFNKLIEDHQIQYSVRGVNTIFEAKEIQTDTITSITLLQNKNITKSCFDQFLDKLSDSYIETPSLTVGTQRLIIRKIDPKNIGINLKLYYSDYGE